MIVIGGGDTGADCIGTSLRHGAASIVNFELLGPRPAGAPRTTPGPNGPASSASTTRTPRKAISGHDPRAYNIMTKEFVADEDGHVKGVQHRRSRLVEAGRRRRPRSAKSPAAKRSGLPIMVLLATGFVGPELTIAEMLGMNTVEPRCGWTTFTAEHGKFATNLDGRLRRRRLPPRPIARRLGHQRRPRRRPLDRRVPDGLHEPPPPGINLPAQVV